MNKSDFTCVGNSLYTRLNSILCKAMTARVKNTFRQYKWLTRDSSGAWVVFRDQPEIDDSKSSFSGPISMPIAFESVSAAGAIPLIFPLDDYRACKLGYITLGGKDIPQVTGGGNIFTFIENYIDAEKTYRNDHGLEDVFSEDPQNSPETTLEEDTTLGGESASPEEEEDPFKALEGRDPKERAAKWRSAHALEDLPQSPGVSLYEKDTSHSLFHKALEEGMKKDPIKFSLIEEDALRNYIKSSVATIVDDVEVDFLMNVIRMLPKQYTSVRRNIKGCWTASNADKSIVIYYNRESELCISQAPLIAFKLKDELVRAHYKYE